MGNDEKEVPQESPVTMGFDRQNPNRFVLTLDLSRVPSATARGLLVESDDVLVKFYKAKAEEINRLRNPGMVDSIKRSGAAFLSKFK